MSWRHEKTPEIKNYGRSERQRGEKYQSENSDVKNVIKYNIASSNVEGRREEKGTGKERERRQKKLCF